MNKGELLSKINNGVSSIRRDYSKKYEFNNRILSFSLACSFALTNFGVSFFNIRQEDSFRTPESVYEYVDKNPYLDDNEKETLHYVEGFINDYYYLFDADTLKNRLQKFDIDYKSLESNIYGSWKPNIDVVNLYYCDKSSDIKNNKSIISHELYHMLSVNYNKQYNECLSEGMASLLNYEYSDFNNSDLYLKERQISRLFTIIVGKESMIDSYLNFDMDKLKNSLLEIYTNKEVLENLFKDIEEYHKLNIDSYIYINKTLDKETYNDYVKLNKKKYELAIKIASNLNYYAMSNELKNTDVFYTSLNSFINSNDEVMKIDSKYYVYLVDEDEKIYTINKNMKKEKALVK